MQANKKGPEGPNLLPIPENKLTIKRMYLSQHQRRSYGL